MQCCFLPKYIIINECTPIINILLSSSSCDHFLVQICCNFISQSAEGRKKPHQLTIGVILVHNNTITRKAVSGDVGHSYVHDDISRQSSVTQIALHVGILILWNCLLVFMPVCLHNSYITSPLPHAQRDQGVLSICALVPYYTLWCTWRTFRLLVRFFAFPWHHEGSVLHTYVNMWA